MRIGLVGESKHEEFEPLIAVAQQINEYIRSEKLANVEILLFSNDEFDPVSLFEQHVSFKKTKSSYFKSLSRLYGQYPDVLFVHAGDYAEPILKAARTLKIPYVVFEANSIAHGLLKKAAKHADAIAIAYEEASTGLPKEKLAHTGYPLRTEMTRVLKDGAYEYLHLDPNAKTILVMGDRPGDSTLNDTIFEAASELLDSYQIVHIVGEDNESNYRQQTENTFSEHQFSERYIVLPELSTLAASMLAGVSDLIITKGDGTLHLTAAWNIPSIIISGSPDEPETYSENAYNYARFKACNVIEFANLKRNLLASEIKRILENEAIYKSMKEGSANFYQENAAQTIAKKLIEIGLSHEV